MGQRNSRRSFFFFFCPPFMALIEIQRKPHIFFSSPFRRICCFSGYQVVCKCSRACFPSILLVCFRTPTSIYYISRRAECLRSFIAPVGVPRGTGDGCRSRTSRWSWHLVPPHTAICPEAMQKARLLRLQILFRFLDTMLPLPSIHAYRKPAFPAHCRPSSSFDQIRRSASTYTVDHSRR